MEDEVVGIDFEKYMLISEKIHSWVFCLRIGNHEEKLSANSNTMKYHN